MRCITFLWVENLYNDFGEALKGNPCLQDSSNFDSFNESGFMAHPFHGFWGQCERSTGSTGEVDIEKFYREESNGGGGEGLKNRGYPM